MARTYIVVDTARQESDAKRELFRGTLGEFDCWFNKNRQRLADLPMVVNKGNTKTYFATSMSGRPL